MSKDQTVRPVRLADQVAAYAAEKRAEIVAFAGSEKRADKFIADMKLLCIDKNLQGCSPITIFTSALNALQLRLSIVKQTGQGYVLPWKNNGYLEAQLQIGYKGWRLICSRAGYNVDCELVFDCDEFSRTMDETGKHISFQPDEENRNPEDGTWCDKHLAGAVVWVSNANGSYPEYVSGKLLRKIRSKSKAPNSPAWRDWTEEMYKAKALKYVASKIPSDNEDLARAVETDNQAMIVEAQGTRPRFKMIPEGPETSEIPDCNDIDVRPDAIYCPDGTPADIMKCTTCQHTAGCENAPGGS